eukprot:2460371-Lingulodinium_polyedra.AAC.1
MNIPDRNSAVPCNGYEKNGQLVSSRVRGRQVRLTKMHIDGNPERREASSASKAVQGLAQLSGN